MRKNFFFIAVSAIVAVSAGIFAYLNSESKANEFFEANVEALAEFESTITCDSGRCGQCYVEIDAWPFYKCNWTGVQADYCDCDKTGWI